jgi:peptidoglycan hydrolase-like protein with peptidoglycan-binding domain
MQKKQKTILIITIVITCLIILGIYLWFNKKGSKPETENNTGGSNYPSFENSDILNQDKNGTVNTGKTNPNKTEEKTSKFYQITNLPVAGAMFLLEKRPISYDEPAKEIRTTIDATTILGRKEIQKILNETLSIKPPLTLDGVFGPAVKKAIENFQKLNDLPVTGEIDETTAPHFYKTSVEERENYEIVPSVRYSEKKNGHIYKKYLDNKVEEKISNSTIPSIYDAYFNQTGNTIIYRYLSSDNQINSFMATMGKSKGEYLPSGVTDISISRDAKKAFYLVESNNAVIGMLKDFETGLRTQIFNSPFTEWLSDWDDNNNVYLTTKPSFLAEGSTYMLNTKTKTFSKVFGNIFGLTSKPNNSGSLIIYSYSSDKGPKLAVFDTKNKTTTELDVYGLPEKCVWSKNNISVYCALPNSISGNQYPDIWYKGLVSFNDMFVEIDASNATKSIIANSTDETAVDGISLFLDDQEETLFFINKKDSTLWSLDLSY